MAAHFEPVMSGSPPVALPPTGGLPLVDNPRFTFYTCWVSNFTIVTSEVWVGHLSAT